MLNNENIQALVAFLGSELNFDKEDLVEFFDLFEAIKEFGNYPDSLYEFSLRVSSSRLEEAIRIVYYDAYSHRNQVLLEKRILLIEQLVSLSIHNHAELAQARKVLKIFKVLRFLKLSIFIGFEKKKQTKLKLKLYLNFFYYRNTVVPYEILRFIFKKFKIAIEIREKICPEISFDLNGSRDLDFKLYYLHDRFDSLALKDFNNNEKTLVQYLNQYNKNEYITITDRYCDDNLLSRKLEVGITEKVAQAVVIKKMFKLSSIVKSEELVRKISKILRYINASLNVVVIEGSSITLYFK